MAGDMAGDGAMTEEQAYQILGLEPGAGPEAVSLARPIGRS